MSASPEARNLLADALAAQGSGWRNAAESIRAGNACNVWIVAALTAIDEALKTEPDDAE